MEEKSDTKKVLIPIAEGYEEIEAVSIIDILRRAGAFVTVVSLMGLKNPLTIEGFNRVYF